MFLLSKKTKKNGQKSRENIEEDYSAEKLIRYYGNIMRITDKKQDMRWKDAVYLGFNKHEKTFLLPWTQMTSNKVKKSSVWIWMTVSTFLAVFDQLSTLIIIITE